MQGLFWVWILHEIEWKDHVKIMYYKYPNLWNNTQRNKYRIQHGLPWHFLKFDVKCDSAHGTHDLPIVSVHKSKSPLQWSKMTIESVWNWMCSSRHKKSTRQKLAHSFHGRPKRERWIDTVLHFFPCNSALRHLISNAANHWCMFVMSYIHIKSS